MLTLAEIRKNAEGLAFDRKLELNDLLVKRNPEILAVDNIHAVGVASYDDGLYLLNYTLTYDITLPSSRSMMPVSLSEKQLVDEVFIEVSHVVQKEDLVEQQLALVIEGDAIDLAESVADNILLAIPLSVLSEEEKAESSMPSGQDWAVMTEEQYDTLQAQKKKETNPFSALEGLFDD
ncbi:DUF177 domain-containing protein [Streptococcus sp. zg-JUN1979]|uniref:DUF177 domain-containing protein n=1 Tax=Streptococcus sp. zg-JUN1979 TaxID=3391450 RepID=UPI0039A4D479